MGRSSKRRVWLRAGIISVVSSSWASLAAADTAAIQSAALTAPGMPAERGFGRALAMDGTVLVVGAPFEMSGGAFQSGSAYVFERDERGAWALTALLAPPAPVQSGRFGAAVSVRGDTIAVGEPGYWTGVSWNNRGRVHVYRREAKGGWEPETTLTSLACPDGVELSFAANFGAAVHLTPDALAVGVPGDFTTTSCGAQAPVGRVIVYVRSGGTDGPWRVQSVVAPPASPFSTGFGSKLAGDDDRVVAAFLPLPVGSSTLLVQSISLPAGTADSAVASTIVTPTASAAVADLALAAFGSRAAVGDRTWSNGDGAVLTLEQNGDGTWSMVGAPLSGADGAGAGSAICLDASQLVIGAPGAASPCAVASTTTGLISAYVGGRAYIFIGDDREGGDWIESGSLLAADDYAFGAMFEPPMGGVPGPCFPTLSPSGAMARSHEIVAVGAPQVSGAPERVWIFGPVSDCDDDGIVDAASIDAGWSADCNENGVLDVCEVASGTETDVNRNGLLDWCERRLGDLNLDGVIDGSDLAIILGQWGMSGVMDLNGDGIVDGADLAVVLGHWGAASYPAACGNGVVNFGENCLNCPRDVQCPPGTECERFAHYSAYATVCSPCQLIYGGPGLPYYSYCYYGGSGFASSYRIDLEEPVLMLGAFGAIVIAGWRGRSRSSRRGDDCADNPA